MACMIMTVDLELLEQTQIPNQQFYLSPQSIHKLIPGLSMSPCKHLARVFNEQMEKMGTTHPGLCHPSAIPPSNHTIALYTKDCFFQMPLALTDMACLIPVLVLCQATSESLFLCHLYASDAPGPLQSWGEQT